LIFIANRIFIKAGGMMRKIFSKKSTKEKRKILRDSITESENLLWCRIRNRQIMNLKFRRQHGIGEYIADFYCPEIKLVIEIDGVRHFTDEGRDYDRIRTKFMDCLEIRTLRFSNSEITNDIEKVLKKIKAEILNLTLITSPY